MKNLQIRQVEYSLHAGDCFQQKSGLNLVTLSDYALNALVFMHFSLHFFCWSNLYLQVKISMHHT